MKKYIEQKKFPLVRYEKMTCSGSQVEYVEVVMPERSRRVDESEEIRKEKRERRRDEKALINAGLQEADSARIASSISRTRTTIRRIVNTNAWQYFDRHRKPVIPKFLTLTFKENITSLQDADVELKKFVRQFNTAFKDILLEPLQYLCVPEFQERGAVHFHMILFNLPYLGIKEFLRIRELWPDRFELKGIVKTNETQAVIGYVLKYISKQNTDGRFFGQKRYFCSRGLNPRIIIRNAQTIATLRRDYLIPFKKDGKMFYPEHMEYLYYEVYYLGDGKTIFSLPLDESVRHALELAAQGREESSKPVEYIEPPDLPSLSTIKDCVVSPPQEKSGKINIQEKLS